MSKAFDMVCPNCQWTNPDSARTCAQCGTALPRGGGEECIQSPELPQDPSAVQAALRRLRRYVPAAVADAVLHDQKQLRDARREVAILFADAVEFTHLSESLDAESVFGLINDLLARLVACIHRYGGAVDTFTGDGLMAVFGAPVAHENDAELAVRAALDMQKAAAEFEPVALAQLGAPLQIRIGVHSGLAVAGILGTAERAAYTVIGSTVNMASRIESLAEPGCVLLSERVYQQTRALFDVRAVGSTQVKGISDPVALYELLGDRAVPLTTRGVAGVTSQLWGRDAELRQLRELVAAFLSGAYGRLVVVCGEAGLGKTRLVTEGVVGAIDGPVSTIDGPVSTIDGPVSTIDGPVSTIDGPVSPAEIWHGRGLPYAQGQAYSLFRSLFQDALRDRLSKVDPQAGARWDRDVPSGLRPFLRRMLSLPIAPDEQATLDHLEPELVRQMTFLAVRAWLLGEARRRPVALILDDVHWADDLSREMLQSVLSLVYEVPLLICVVTRPHPDLNLVAKPEQLPGASTPADPPPLSLDLSLDLQPLSPEHCRSLLAHLVDLDTMPGSLVDTILARSEGNPFHIEEFVRMLIEKQLLTLDRGRWRVASNASLPDLEIPATLRGLMMARVDRLPRHLQDVLRHAAVIGLQFSAHLLEAVEGELQEQVNVALSLERLEGLGLLVQRTLAGEAIYAFRHVLTQETVYNSLLYSQRPRLHHAVAVAIESVCADDLDRQIERLAHHYDRARVHDKAMHYALLAGDRARARFANRDAIEYYGRALQLSQHLSGCEQARWHAVVGLGDTEQHVGAYEAAVACYTAALDEWGGTTAPERAQVMLRLAQVWDKQGNLDEAARWLNQAWKQLGSVETAFPGLQARIHSDLGWLDGRRGRLADAEQQLEQALALASKTEYPELHSSILNRLSALSSIRPN